jgi:recombinational DNA repair protein (RecF pathway)
MLRFGSGEGHLDSYDTLRLGLEALENVATEMVEALGIRAIWGLVSSLGFEPTLDQCVKCGNDPGTGELPFDHASGGALCPGCARQTAPARLNVDDRADLVALIRADLPLPRLSPRQAAAHRRLLARYIQHHLGEGTALPALDFWIRRPWGAA